MKSTSSSKSNPKKQSGDIRAEYRFDYSKAKPNRFAGRSPSRSGIVLLDPDIAKVFKSSEDVNSALRAILAAIPRGSASKK
jgi:hypothetical protein